VKADGWKSGILEKRLEGPLPEVGGIHERAPLSNHPGWFLTRGRDDVGLSLSGG
jgi:hypothetical protein